ncbi:MAG: hypothetical protein ACOH2D_11720 [Gelidibacter sp.]
MEMETLKKAIAIKKDIDAAEFDYVTVERLYAKIPDLTPAELDQVFVLAHSNTRFVIDQLKIKLKQL